MIDNASGGWEGAMKRRRRRSSFWPGLRAWAARPPPRLSRGSNPSRPEREEIIGKGNFYDVLKLRADSRNLTAISLRPQRQSREVKRGVKFRNWCVGYFLLIASNCHRWNNYTLHLYIRMRLYTLMRPAHAVYT